MTKITSFSQLDPDKYYTYSDYLTWQFKERVELFLGRVTKMSPAPNVNHQRLSSNILGLIWNFIRYKECQVFSAPFDIRLPITNKKGHKDTVVQPDIVVICDESKLDEQGCNGAPDIVVEILSPGNCSREMKDKFELYELSNVPEYWIVDPEHQDITVYSLNEVFKYIGSKPFVSGEVVRSQIIQGMDISVGEVFA